MKLARPTSFAWLATLAFLLHALMPLLHAVHGPAGTFVTLCSAASGTRDIFIPSEQGSEQDSVLKRWLSCPACLAGGHYALPGLTRAGLVMPDLRHDRPYVRVLATQVAIYGGFYFSSRAPPHA